MDSDSSGLLDEVSATPAKEFFPMCIVWSPIPMLTWMLPVSGHLGMSDSSGVISDFAGTFHIHQNRKRTAFGSVTKFLPVKASDLHALPSGTSESAAIAAWNRAVTAANKTYEVILCVFVVNFFLYDFASLQTHMHNLLMDNCHHHVAVVLNELRYLGFSKWGTVSLHFLMMRRSRFVSVSRFLMTYGGFFCIVALVVFVVVVAKLV
jgi:hypothetical protein